MKITNKTTKIIGIAGVAILPNESATISAADAESSMLKHFASTGKISLREVSVECPHVEELPVKEGNGSEDAGKKKPLSRMNKDDLVAECQRLGIEVGPDDTNPDLVDKIKAATAE